MPQFDLAGREFPALARAQALPGRDKALRDYSENQIIAAFAPLLPLGFQTVLGPGDDCAEIAVPSGSFLVSTDVLVERVHFRTQWSGAHEIGRRAVAQNLADIAGQGGIARAITVGLALPSSTTLGWMLDFAAGLADACAPHAVGVVGGDITTAAQIMISITVHGEAPEGSVRRSGGQAGDILAVCGTLGHSRAGYEALRSGRAAEFPEFVDIFRVPRPPLAAGPAAAEAGAQALMDLSDGLVLDGGRMGKASGLALSLEPERLAPAVALVAPAAEALQGDAWEWVLSGGEDHSLLGAFAPGTPLPAGFFPIGHLVAGTPGEITGLPAALRGAGGGWDPFRGD